jgi:outer membrane protein
MNKAGFFLNGVLLCAVIVLYALHFSGNKANTTAGAGQTPAKPTVSAPMPIKLKSTPIVYINADSLMSRYSLVKKTKAELERERKVAEAEFEKRYRALEKEFMELRDRAPLMKEEEGMAKQQELMQKEQKLGEYREQMQEKLMKMEESRNLDIQKRITGYLKERYSGSKYAYILGYSAGGGILFANDSLDITEEVIQGLNARP